MMMIKMMIRRVVEHGVRTVFQYLRSSSYDDDDDEIR